MELHNLSYQDFEASHTGGPACWLWKLHISRAGYGKYKSELAHRVAFYLAYGFLPPVVRHKCDNRACVNPKHLEPGDTVDNVRDMYKRGRAKRPHKINGVWISLSVRKDDGE